MFATQDIAAQIAIHEQQVAALREQMATAQAAEKQAAIADIVEKIVAFKIIPVDLFSAEQLHGPATARKKAERKYRDPATGETWSGRGRTPAWIAGQNKESFLIASEMAVS